MLGIHVPVVWNLHIQPAPGFHKMEECTSCQIMSPWPPCSRKVHSVFDVLSCCSWSCLKWNRALCISGADNCISQENHSNYDTSNGFGTHTLQGSPCRKMTWAMQNFKMSAIFHDGRHGLPWNPIFAIKWHQMVEKDHSDNKVCVLSM